jgi:hypothetical protein
MSQESTSPALDKAIDEFNRGDFFAAAEIFEQVALAATGDDRALAAAFNRIAAALHLRLERGGRQSSINLMSQAMLALEDLKPERAGIDIARLCDELYDYIEEVRAAPRAEREGLKHRARIFLERRRAPKINRKP